MNEHDIVDELAKLMITWFRPGADERDVVARAIREIKSLRRRVRPLSTPRPQIDYELLIRQAQAAKHNQIQTQILNSHKLQNTQD